MRYGKIEGTIFFRLAKTAPIINSALATDYGLEAPLACAPQYGIEPGKNVKLRFFFGDARQRMTCHARIDWVKEQKATGEHKIGFSHLSLSDDEFKVLIESFTEPMETSAELRGSVRQLEEATTIVLGQDDRDVMRDKAVTMPVSLIDKIDRARGKTPFSEFVVSIVAAQLKD
jgi:hypothetical protein